MTPTTTDRTDGRAGSDAGTCVIACSAWFGEQIGGSFKLATEFAQYLASQGRRVCYVCGTAEAGYRNPTEVDGVELWRYPLPRARSPHPANLIGHVRGTARLVGEIKRQGPIAFINGHTPLQFIGAVRAVERGVRAVYSAHSPFVEELEWNWKDRGRGVRQRIATMIAQRIEAAICRRADVIQSDSQYTVRLLDDRYRGAAAKSVVCPGWVDVDRFRSDATREELRRRLGGPWSSDRVTFLTVRRLERRMGVEELVRAARLLVDEGFDFQVLVGGAGAMREDLDRLIVDLNLSNHVVMLGRVPDDELPLNYAAADCFVLPTSGLECFGLIVLEAFAAGTPVIATPVGAIPEVIGPLGSWLTPGVAAADIAKRMRQFLKGELSWDREALRSHAELYAFERVGPELAALCEAREAPSCVGEMGVAGL